MRSCEQTGGRARAPHARRGGPGENGMPRAAAPAGAQSTGAALLGGVHHEKRENRDGVIEVPQEPGFGLELDWQQARNTASVGNRWRKAERHTGKFPNF